MWAATFEFNMREPPFSDKTVRQAFAMAIDLDDINTKVFNDIGTVHHGMYTQYVPWAFNPDAKMPSLDRERAEQLLDEAGYPRGGDDIRFSIECVFPDWAGYISEGIAAVVKEHLREVGVELNYQTLEWGTWYERVRVNHDFETTIYPGEWHGPDPNIVAWMYKTDGQRNTMGYSNPEVDRLLAEGIESFDREERKESYFRVQEILAEDVPFIFINDIVLVYANRADFHGFPYEENIGLDSNPRYEYVWWEGGTETTGTDWTTFGVITAAVIVVAVVAIVMWRRSRR
jgi:peptide/nickel transport system substrate-binding protein